jgi:hypothetical protein
MDIQGQLGRYLTGFAMTALGAQSLLLAIYVGRLQPIPEWVPGHFAAGVSILTLVMARLAATLAGIMYGSWVLLVHIPRVMAMPDDAFEWNGIFVATALCGSALNVASRIPARGAT